MPLQQEKEICNEPVDGTSKATLELKISRLRKKFVEVGMDKSLQALRGDGYRLLVDMQLAF